MSRLITERLSALPAIASSLILRDALDIWRAGVQAVLPSHLIETKIYWEPNRIVVDDTCVIDLGNVRRLVVVGAGKASAAMATALHSNIFRHHSASSSPEIVGWINAPEGTFDRQLPGVRLHAARPAGKNMPTQSAVDGTNQIIKLVSQATSNDVVLCLLSGGGSALLVAPQPGITLADKQAVAHHIAAAGGDIYQLNAVRRCLSRVKGGGLARACRASRLVTLIISDVPGDPLEVIASGPTVVPDQTVKPTTIIHPRNQERREALAVLQELDLLQTPELASVVRWLRSMPHENSETAVRTSSENIILGNNADAVDAAGIRAVELGYRYFMESARQPEGDVSSVANRVLHAIGMLREHSGVDCWISGGEPTVRLPAIGAGKGGRNQQLSLSVLRLLVEDGWPDRAPGCELAFVSGGTDGEDGPTDAAGAGFDATTIRLMQQLGCHPADYLRRADAYNFFSRVGGLMQTGPTGTNVCDLRVALCKIRE